MAENLASKYRPKTLDEMTEQTVVRSIVANLCNADDITHRNFLFIGPAGTGKAQPLTSKVLTPDGFINMREVTIGTQVITRLGEVATVSGVYPQGVRPVYEMKLQDGTKIRIADNHLNVIYRYNENKKMREEYVLTTLELIDFMQTSKFKLRVDTPDIRSVWSDGDLDIDPYLLGVLIGDGSLSSGNFGMSNQEQDIIEKVSTILETNYQYALMKTPGENVDWSISPMKPWKYHIQFKGQSYYSLHSASLAIAAAGYPSMSQETILHIARGDFSTYVNKYPELRTDLRIVEENLQWGCNLLMNQLKSYELTCKSVDKHIPRKYLLSSRESRIRLLQGLYDTDGYTSPEGGTEWYTTSPQLSDDFAFLVRSLGIRDTVKQSKAGYKNSSGEYVQCADVYTHYLHMPVGFHDFCTSEKHRARLKDRQNDPIRNIVSIDYIGEEECQCIMVDNPDHTYISDDFIPTHNTTTAKIVGSMLNGSSENCIEIDAASYSGVDAMRGIMDQARSYPVGTKYKIFIVDECHALSQNAWQVALKTIEEQPAKSIFIWCTTNPEKIPATILSRVQTFQLSKISLEGIHDRLIYIINKENEEGRGITYQDSAVTYIAKLAQGGMRDAITLLDKAVAYSNNITDETLREALGLPNYDDYFELLNAIAKKNNESIIKIINDVYNSGVNFVKWFDGFFSFVTNIVKYIYMQDINSTMIPAIYADKLAKYSTAHSILCLKLSNKLVKMNQELKSSQYLQELAIAHLCTPPEKKG